MDTKLAPAHELPEIELPDDERNLIPDNPLPDAAARNVSGINIGGHTVTRATAHLPEDQRIAIRWLHDYARKNRLSWRELSEKTEISTATLSRVFSDQYRYPKNHKEAGERVPLGGIVQRIKKFRHDAESSGKAKNPDYIQLTIGDKIWWLCERAARNRRMAFIYGAGQVGMSTALKEYAAQHNGGATSYSEMPPASGVQMMLKKVAKALEVPTASAFDKMLDDVIAALDPSKLLIMDEMDRVFSTIQKKSTVRCLETLRYIYDQTGCGMVLAGNNKFRDEIENGEFKLELRRFHRRGRSYELQLPTEPPEADLEMMAYHFGLEPAKGDAAEIIHHIAKEDGIGVYKLRLIDARDYAKKKNQDLKWEHFVKAYAITEKAGQRLTQKPLSTDR